MAHPDEYWQVTQVAYSMVYPDSSVVLPWEFHPDFRLRNLIYPIAHSIPLYLLKTLGLDSNIAVQLCPYVLHGLLLIISDAFLWQIGKKIVGKESTQISFIFYLSNRFQNAFITRCFTNSLEQIINIIAFDSYLKLKNQFDIRLAYFTALLSI